MNPKEDGVTHINIYSKGATELGRWLSNFAKVDIQTEDGPFRSIEGYWYWLSCKDNQLRLLYGYKAKEYGRSVGAKDWLDDREFKDKICRALVIKLERMPLDFKNLWLSSLPLTHYYTYGDKVIIPKDGQWLIDFLESQRK